MSKIVFRQHRSFATGRCPTKFTRCPLCFVCDGRPQEGGLSRWDMWSYLSLAYEPASAFATSEESSINCC